MNYLADDNFASAKQRLSEIESLCKNGQGRWSEMKQQVKELRKRLDDGERSRKLHEAIFAIPTE